ncbi:MAG TPA: TIM barrel protein [Anaerolineales bacterium]|nr:TIM barrel protein [Anaerolineales bacterium]
MTQSHQIKRGVSLYSFQEEFFLRKMTLEDCIAACAKLGAKGIETIGEQMMPGFPHLSDAFYDQWHGWMAKYGTTPTCHDMFLDTKKYKGRLMTDDEMLASVIRDLKHASRLGCTVIRVIVNTPPHIMELAAPYAEQYNVRLGLEIHAPFHFRHEWIQKHYEVMERTGSKFLGFVPDMGVYERRFPRVRSERSIRNGAKAEIVKYICDAYEGGADLEAVAEEVKRMGGGQLELGVVDDVKRVFFDDPRRLLQFMPRVFHIHAKFYEMVDDATEYSIPYNEVIPVLIEGGYSGYLSSEYEGNRHIQDVYEVDSLEQVRRQQAMFKSLLGEA